MQTSRAPIVVPILFTAFAGLLVPSAAVAADGINRLVAVAHLNAEAASDQALEGASKQEDLVKAKSKIRAAQSQLEALKQAVNSQNSQAAKASSVASDVAAVAAFESTASTDGLDDAERKTLVDLVAAAQQRVDAATAEASAEIVNAKKQLTASADKEPLELHLKSLRATAKAHRRTAKALRTLAKKLSR